MDSQVGRTQRSFEGIKHVENGVEYWSARELMPLLDYSTWRMFEKTIDRAILAANKSGTSVNDHFVGANKMVLTGSGAEREVVDFHLTRYACYLIAQNGDPRKQAIAQAQTYFAVQTRKQEVAQANAEDLKRLQARERLSATERRFSGVLSDRDIDSKGIAEIRSSGDQLLFGGHSTQAMKKRYDIPMTKPLADYLPTVTLKAKDLAAEMTTVNTLQNDLRGKPRVKQEHDQNNRSVRRALLDRGIEPETLPPEEDIKRVERRVSKAKQELAE